MNQGKQQDELRDELLCGSAKPIDRLMLPLRLFLHTEASGGVLLVAATLIALIWANSPWSESYFALWQTPVVLSVGEFLLNKPLLIWINDGLMAMFFFVVGLEIKREIMVGELSSFRLASLPIAGAIGGMLVPAAFYLLFTFGTESADGWGVPMATDIAFALGILALFKGVPTSLKIFLAALAIVDDLGAVLIIAFFYTSKLSVLNLAIGAGFLISLITANLLGVRSLLVYGLLGIGGLWLAFLLSGIHPTVAGVLAALCIPAVTRIDTERYVRGSRDAIDRFEQAGEVGESVLTNPQRQAALLRHKLLYENATTPLQRLEEALHPWVIFFVMPVFALANAGVEVGGGMSGLLTVPAGAGIIAGLLLGKQLGIFGGAWIAVKLGIAELPQQVNWLALYGVSWLGGIGFTMSLFIAGLAFRDQALLSTAKLAILVASLLSAVGGWFFISRSLQHERA